MAKWIIRIASSAVVTFVLNIILPHSLIKTAVLLLVGLVATYLYCSRELWILKRSPAGSSVMEHLGIDGWQQENRRLAAACASMMIVGGVFSLTLRAWIGRMALAVPEMIGISDIYAFGQVWQTLRGMTGIVLHASSILLLMIPGLLLYGFANSWGREAVVKALPVEARAHHLRFERSLCLLYLGISVVISSLPLLISLYDVLVLSLLWPITRPIRAEESLLQGGLKAGDSAERAALMSFAGTLVIVPAVLALMADRYDYARYAFGASYLLLPAIPFALAGYSGRLQRGTACLVLAFSITAGLVGLGLYVGLRFPRFNPAGLLVLDVTRECIQASVPAVRSAMMARIGMVTHLLGILVIAFGVVLYPVAVLQALAERWFYRGRLSQWYGYLLLSFAAFVGGIAFLGQLAASQIISALMYKAPHLSSMAVMRRLLTFHVAGLLVFLVVAICGWSVLKKVAQLGFFKFSSDYGWKREVGMEERWQRASMCVAVGGIVLSAWYGMTLLNETKLRVNAMEQQVVREQAEVRQAVNAHDWRKVGIMASRSSTGEARMAALLAIGSHGRVGLLPVVISDLSDPNPSVSATALTTCAYLGDPRALPKVRAWRTQTRSVYLPFVDLAIRRLTEMSKLDKAVRHGQISRSTYARMARKSLQEWSAEDARLRRDLAEPRE